MVATAAPPPTCTPALAAAWATYQRETAAWRASDQTGECPRLVLPIDRPQPMPWREGLDRYRVTLQCVAAHLETLDMFDVPSLQRPDIRRAEQRIAAAFRVRDWGQLVVALNGYERAITGR
jgi:hypothetical protein